MTTSEQPRTATGTGDGSADPVPAVIGSAAELEVDFVADGDTDDGAIHRSIRALRDQAVGWTIQHLAPIPAHHLQVTVRRDGVEKPVLIIAGSKSHAIDELTEWLDTERGRTARC